MATWDSYTQKNTPSDNDTLMIKDTDGGVNKRTPFSGVWDWIVGKLTSAVISNLETTNKSIVPAINELNSKFKNMYFYRPNTNQVIDGLKISLEYTSRNNMLLWGQRNGDVMPFGLLIGISPSANQSLQYMNLTTNEVNPNWDPDDLSVNLPANTYTDMIIISCVPLTFTQY